MRFLAGENEIYVMSRDGSRPRRLTRARQDLKGELTSQAWSPDGHKLVFARGPTTTIPDERASIYVMNANATAMRRLTRGRDDYPAWSPRGGKIAFVRRLAYGYEIYVMNADGSRQHPVADAGGDAIPAWSPDGRKLAVEGSDDELVVVSASGRLVRRLPPTHWNGYSLPDYDPTWSPDGRKIAFEADPGPDAGSTWIEVSNADGSGRRVLTDRSGDYAFEHPAWSPNGREIAFDKSGTLTVINADGSNQHALAPK